LFIQSVGYGFTVLLSSFKGFFHPRIGSHRERDFRHPDLPWWHLYFDCAPKREYKVQMEVVCFK
jgi:hypothetical protein